MHAWYAPLGPRSKHNLSVLSRGPRGAHHACPLLSFSVFSLPDSPSCSPLAILLSLKSHAFPCCHPLKLWSLLPAVRRTSRNHAYTLYDSRVQHVRGCVPRACCARPPCSRLRAGITSVMSPVCGCVPLAGDIYGSLESLGGRVGC